MRALSRPDTWIEAYSQVGSANKRSFQKLTCLLSEFRVYGIDALLLKGADVLPRRYGVWGIRPMADGDLFVHITMTVESDFTEER
jgi:hypothetical protein